MKIVVHAEVSTIVDLPGVKRISPELKKALEESFQEECVGSVLCSEVTLSKLDGVDDDGYF